MEQLAATMTAQEFGLHYALECAEPLEFGPRHATARLLAAAANGPLKAPEPGRIWQSHDFLRDHWAAMLDQETDSATQAREDEQDLTVEAILARGAMAGMRVT